MKFRYALLTTALVGATTACKTASNQAQIKDDDIPASPAAEGSNLPEPSAPWAQGESNGLKWESRFNFPPCDHAEGPKGAHCEREDVGPAAQKSGVEARLRQWAMDPKVKSLHLVYFSFSNRPVREILCEAATARKDLVINVYLHRQNIPAGDDGSNVAVMQKCSPENLKVIARGTEFGSGYLNHAKIFLALETVGPVPLHDMSPEEARLSADATVRFTSSSANMSSYGTGTHLENWLLFEAKANDSLAQEHICMFSALQNMRVGVEGVDERRDFAELNDACRKKIQSPKRADIVFYPVPHHNLTPPPYQAMRKLIQSARSEIKIAIHRLTTQAVGGPLAETAQQGVKVRVLYDDDTLRVGKCNGGPALDQGAQDVDTYRKLRAAGVETAFVGSNGELPHLHHNKFMIVDDKVVMQGAGNFTATSLNVSNPGNIENFMIITNPEIVQAYVKGWDYLRSIAQTAEEHPVGANPDKALVPGGQLGMQFDSSSCN